MCSGETLANTEYFIILRFKLSSLILSNSLPVILKSLLFKIPKSLAIAFAVSIWSPVIITVFIPALLQVLIASFTPSLGGSIIPTKPTKFKFISNSSLVILLGITFISLYATAITLSAFSAIFLLLSNILLVIKLFKVFSSSTSE